MSSARLLDLFKRDLENLKDNDKYKISALTVFARDHKDEENIPEGIVDLTTKHVHSIPAGLKLLGLYVIDSIVKNVGVPFRKLYTGTIVDAFVHSFQAVCAVCYEKFDVFWDHDEEEWMLRDAVLLQDKVYHPICQEDAGKEFPFVSNVAHDMQEVPLSPSVLKCEPTVASESTTNSASSPSDENAFVCDDQQSAKIPGLSPDKSPTSPTIVTVPFKPDPDTSPEQSAKPEHNEIIPVYEHIKADPLAALRAVLHGGVSSLTQPPPSSP